MRHAPYVKAIVVGKVRFWRAPFAGTQMIFPPFGIFWPRPDGQGLLLKISIVTWKCPNVGRHNPSKGEGTPATHKELCLGKEGRTKT